MSVDWRASAADPFPIQYHYAVDSCVRFAVAFLQMWIGRLTMDHDLRQWTTHQHDVGTHQHDGGWSTDVGCRN